MQLNVIKIVHFYKCPDLDFRNVYVDFNLRKCLDLFTRIMPLLYHLTYMLNMLMLKIALITFLQLFISHLTCHFLAYKNFAQ